MSGCRVRLNMMLQHAASYVGPVPLGATGYVVCADYKRRLVAVRFDSPCYEIWISACDVEVIKNGPRP